jgi:guanylate kinase
MDSYFDILAITGPSGAGKTSICQRLGGLGLGVPSRTVTTRRPRGTAETTSQQYEFVTQTEFDDLQDNKELLVVTMWCGAMYGLRKTVLADARSNGRRLILDTIAPIHLLRAVFDENVRIVMVRTQMISTLETRIRRRSQIRGSDTELRLVDARLQLQHEGEADLLVLNDDGQLDAVVEEIWSFVANEERMPARF